MVKKKLKAPPTAGIMAIKVQEIGKSAEFFNKRAKIREPTKYIRQVAQAQPSNPKAGIKRMLKPIFVRAAKIELNIEIYVVEVV